jgi:hypothetical protein
MKSKKSAIAFASLLLVTVFSSSAFADDKWIGDQGTNWLDHIKSTKSRAEVIAEMEQARKDGTLQVGNGSSYPPAPAMASGSGKTRAQVQAEAAQANQSPRDRFDNMYYGS